MPIQKIASAAAKPIAKEASRISEKVAVAVATAVTYYVLEKVEVFIKKKITKPKE